MMTMNEIPRANRKPTSQRQIRFAVELLGFDSFDQIGAELHPERVVAHQVRVLDQFEMLQDVLLFDQMNAVELCGGESAGVKESGE